jgi:hypothetical protein
MGFQKSINHMTLQEFRPGIWSTAEFGDKLVMACMEIGPEKEDTGHLKNDLCYYPLYYPLLSVVTASLSILRRVHGRCTQRSFLFVH